MKRKLIIIAVLFALGTVFSFIAKAETMGAGSFLDSRVQTALYTPDNIFRVQAVIGRTSLIQLQLNETVNEESGLITAGDPDAWEIGVNKAGNMVSIKPKNPNDPDTNLTINTNRRTYLLELKLVERVALMTSALRWTYPEPPGSKKTAVAQDVPVDPCKGPRNVNYQRRGDRVLSPLEAWDNGTFTCFRFPTNAPRPVVYQVLPDGTETLANGRTVQNIAVVFGVSQLFRLRLNDQVLEIRTRHKLGGFYNYSGTTTGETRVVKNADQ